MIDNVQNHLQISGGFPGGWDSGEVARSQANQGYVSRRGAKSAFHQRRVMEAARLMTDVMNGKTHPMFLQEAMSPSQDIFVAWLQENYPALYPQGTNVTALRETMSVTDYQALFVDVLDRLYYGYYNGFPIVNLSVCRQHDCRDFRVVSRYLLDGLVSPFQFMDAAAPPIEQSLSGPVPQDGSTFPTTNTAPIQYQPRLAQAMASVNWRATVNDDLGIFRDIPKRLAMTANRGITSFINGLYTAFGGYTQSGAVIPGAGFNTALYNSGYANIVNEANGASSNNPALGAQGIMDGLKIFAGMKDSSGQPIMMMGRIKIVYGPSNFAVAKNLQNMLSNHVSVEGGSQNSEGFPTQWIETNGWVAQNIDWIMDPYIQTPYNTQPGTWFMFMDPDSLDRPAIEFGILQGFKIPQLFQRVPNTMRVGGGVEPQMGDFLTMDSDMKIVSVFGGTQIDGRSTVASNGTGS